MLFWVDEEDKRDAKRAVADAKAMGIGMDRMFRTSLAVGGRALHFVGPAVSVVAASRKALCSRSTAGGASPDTRP